MPDLKSARSDSLPELMVLSCTPVLVYLIANNQLTFFCTYDNIASLQQRENQ